MKKILAVVILFLSPLSLANDVDCLAKNIYWEARNQSINGMYAVAKVTLNRVSDSRWPSTVCAVVKQRKHRGGSWICQFSWYCDGKSDEPIEPCWEEIFTLAEIIIGWESIDFTDGSLWYHSTKVSPEWANHYAKTVQIDNHIFYKPLD